MGEKSHVGEKSCYTGREIERKQDLAHADRRKIVKIGPSSTKSVNRQPVSREGGQAVGLVGGNRKRVGSKQCKSSIR